MRLYKNIKTEEVLTESELMDLQIKQWTEIFNNSNNPKSYTFKNCGGSLIEWINYMKNCNLEDENFVIIQE